MYNHVCTFHKHAHNIKVLFTGAERDLVFESESIAMPSLSNVRKTQKQMDPVLLDPSTLIPLKP